MHTRTLKVIFFTSHNWHPNYAVSHHLLPVLSDGLPLYSTIDVTSYSSIPPCMSVCQRNNSNRTLLPTPQRCHRSRFCRTLPWTLGWVQLAAKPDWEGQSVLFSCYCSEMSVRSWTCWHQHQPRPLISVNTLAVGHTQMACEVCYRQWSLGQISFLTEPQYGL